MGIPVIGDAKGAVHYLIHDKEGGNSAMKSASRTVGAIGGVVIGSLVGGPVGAVAVGNYTVLPLKLRFSRLLILENFLLRVQRVRCGYQKQ